MGKGKGSVDHYVANVRVNMMIFELDQVTEEQAREAFRLGMHKLPVKCKFVVKGEED
jgi:large subunit ribosomal protein L16